MAISGPVMAINRDLLGALHNLLFQHQKTAAPRVRAITGTLL